MVFVFLLMVSPHTPLSLISFHGVTVPPITPHLLRSIFNTVLAHNLYSTEHYICSTLDGRDPLNPPLDNRKRGCYNNGMNIHPSGSRPCGTRTHDTLIKSQDFYLTRHIFIDNQSLFGVNCHGICLAEGKRCCISKAGSHENEGGCNFLHG